MVDTLLDLDVSSVDGLYRISRNQSGTQRVVYVYIADIEFIPEASRTSKDELLRDLARLDKWHDIWDTLTVSKSGDVQCNTFKPHGLYENEIINSYPSFNILDLQIISVKKSRVRYVQMNSTMYYLKIARFQHELTSLRREIRAYATLEKQEITVAPKFIGYAHEGARDRVIGFILEAVSGKRASIADLALCENAVRKLHRANIIHGDLLRDNILITDYGAKIIDFENSCIVPIESTQDWDSRKTKEFHRLAIVLNDDSDVGKPWDDH